MVNSALWFSARFGGKVQERTFASAQEKGVDAVFRGAFPMKMVVGAPANQRGKDGPTDAFLCTNNTPYARMVDFHGWMMPPALRLSAF